MRKAKSIKTDIEKYLQELNIKLPNTMSAQTSTSTPSPLKKTTKEKILEDNPDAIPSVQYAAASENRPSMPAMNPYKATGKVTPEQAATAELYSTVQQQQITQPQVQEQGIQYAEQTVPKTSTASTTTATTPTPTTTTENVATETVPTQNTKGETSTPEYLDYDTWKWIAAQQEREKAAAQEQHDIATAYANAQYGQAMEASAQAHEKALNDAMNAYALRRSTYGSQGESMGRNGLAMSGYSDYADQVAYATSRGEIAQAGANRTLAEQNAMNAYQEYLANADIAKSEADKNADVNFYKQMGAWKQEQDAWKQEQDYKQAQYEAALKEQQAKNFETIAGYLADNPNVYTKEQLQGMVDADYLSQEHGDAAISMKDQYEKSQANYVKGINDALDAAAGTDPNELFKQLETVIEGDFNETKIDNETRQLAYDALALRKAMNVDETNYTDMKELFTELKSEGKMSTEGYIKAIQQIEKSIGDLKYQKTNTRATVSADGQRLEVNGVTLSQAAALDSKSNRMNYKGIGETLNNFLNAYVGEEPGMLASKEGEKVLYVRLNDAWYEVKQNAMNELWNFMAGMFYGAEYNGDKVGAVKSGIFKG